MEEESRKEPGCHSYAFSVDVNDATTVRIFERWESMQDLEAHFKLPHMAAFREAIVAIEPKSLDIKVYDIAGELALPS